MSGAGSHRFAGRRCQHQEDHGESVDQPEHWLPASLLEMAGMSRLAPQHIRENSGPLYGDFTPASLRGALLSDPSAPRRLQTWCWE